MNEYRVGWEDDGEDLEDMTRIEAWDVEGAAVEFAEENHAFVEFYDGKMVVRVVAKDGTDYRVTVEAESVIQFGTVEIRELGVKAT